MIKRKISLSLAAYSAIWLLAMVTFGHASPDQIKMFGRIAIGNWRVYAVADEVGFSHCSATALTPDGTLVAFTVGEKLTWSVGFYKDSWKIPSSELRVMLGVDDMAPLQFDASVIKGRNVEIGFGEEAGLLTQFVKGRRLKVLGMPKPIDFNLSGADRALPALLGCALAKGQKKIPNLRRDPAADIPGYTARQMRSDGEMIVEATTLAANLLSEMGVTGYRLLGPKEEPKLKGDARWIIPGQGIGVIQIYPDMTREKQQSFGGTLIAEDAKDCKGTFMSSTLPDDEQIGSARVFTACDTGNAALISYYFTMPRPAGGIYLVATISKEASEVAPQVREADTKFRKAAFTIRPH